MVKYYNTSNGCFKNIENLAGNVICSFEYVFFCGCSTVFYVAAIFFFTLIASTETHQIWGQGNSNLRTRVIRLETTASRPKNQLSFDTLSIVPASLTVFALPNMRRLDSSYYQPDYAAAMLTWTPAPPAGIDSILLQYRVFPFALGKPVFDKQRNNVQETPDTRNMDDYYRYEVNQQTDKQSLFSSSGLDYNGSIARSIAFGNTQDMTVNSNFNLQMSGKVAGDVEVLAAMTDNNIPFQPEGNTQQIQDFDRIYIQLKRRKSILLLGDYDLRRPPDSYFMNYSRRQQGAMLQTTQKWGKGEWQAGASAAIARGNYNRQTLTVIEGNQGPYKLLGANGETFVIVLSGSERVFIDGKLLTRGYNNDYVIDYNTAEISFTPRQIITKDKRVVVEFQYADRNYLRSTFSATTAYTTSRLSLRAALFAEQDAKNQPLFDSGLSDENKAILAAAGDNPTKAVVRSIDSIGYQSARVMYRMTDTLVAQQPYDSVFVYSNNPLEAVYVLSFSYVGAGRGNYVLNSNGINGRVYRWVSPDTLTHQFMGDYEPIIQLITPFKRHLYTLGGEYRFSERSKLLAEVAVSNQDRNLFSENDDANNKGIAFKAHYENTLLFDTLGKNRLTAGLDYEWVNANFRPIEIYRSVEFGRDWNYKSPIISNTIGSSNNSSGGSENVQDSDEHIASAAIKFDRQNRLQLGYRFAWLQREKNYYKGLRHVLEARYSDKKWLCTANVSYLKTEADGSSGSNFWRPNFDVSYQFGKKTTAPRVGFRFEMERNELWTGGETKILQPTAFFFHQTSLYGSIGDTAKVFLRTTVLRRYDLAPAAGDFLPANHAFSVNVNGGVSKGVNHQLTWSASYRRLTVSDTLLSAIKKGNSSVVGELNHNWIVGKGFFRINTQYQLGSGQRQRTEYFYQKVPAGQGSYVWRDRNENGLEDLDEFEQATLNDIVFADYIQVVLPTTTYEATNIVQFNQSLQLQPKSLWFEAKGLRRFLSLWSWVTAISLRRETLAAGAVAAHFVPFTNVDDSDLAGENTTMRHTLFFNRNSPRFEASLYASRAASATYLVNGTDRRIRTEQGLLAKLGLGRRFSTDLKSMKGSNVQDSEAFANRNFDIDFYSIEPSLTFMPGKTFRLTGTYRYKHSLDQNDTLRQPAIAQQLSLDTRYGNALKSSIGAKFSLVMLSYAGNNNTTTAYTLLEGFQTGKNYTWTISFDTRISGNIQLSLGYDGRQSGTSPIQHIGRASLRAVF